MPNTILQKQLKEINNSTLQNMRFLLESYSNEVLEALDQQAEKQTEPHEYTCNTIKRKVSSVIRTLQGIETVINHHTYTKRQGKHHEEHQLPITDRN